MPTTTGLFIVFEGGDGVGKTTQVDLLCSWLESRGERVVRTHEPGDTPVGRLVRQILLDPETAELSPRAEALLYAADKAQHVHAVVRPALDAGAVVVCDRYVDSMLAYQGAGRVLDLVDVERVARWATEDLRPHLIVVLDTDPQEAVQIKADKDRLESAGETFHHTVRQQFVDLAAREPDRYLVLDGRGSRERIADLVAGRVADLLSAR